MAAALTVTQLFDSLAIRIDGERAWDTSASIRWHFTDTGESYRMELSNGALIHTPTSRDEPADVVITLTRAQLLAMLGGAGTDGINFEGRCQDLHHHRRTHRPSRPGLRHRHALNIPKTCSAAGCAEFRHARRPAPGGGCGAQFARVAVGTGGRDS